MRWIAALLAAIALGGVGPSHDTGGASATGGAPSPGERRSVAWVTRTMGTYVRVTVVTADSAAAEPKARIAQAAFRRIDSLMTNWTTTSEVARLNREAATSPTVVDPEVARVIEASIAVGRESDGAFDITVEPLIRAWGFLGGPRRVPDEAEQRAAFALVGAGDVRFDSSARTIRFARHGMRVDLGGIAKGYAVDLAMRELRARG